MINFPYISLYLDSHGYFWSFI